ncbi:MAG: protein-tyrosine-phosphatase [Verrucomicrobiales bacterium]|jgi:protein-tyrosine-phosphatase
MLDRFFAKRRRPHLLFICTANLCRSPMAEAICRPMLGSREWDLSSAGFFSDHTLPPVPEVLALLKIRGLDADHLTSKRVEKPLVRRATGIFAMTETHLITLRKQFPKAASRAHLVTEFSTIPAYRDQDVPDPIGLDQSAFEETFHILEDAIPQIIAYLES